MRRAWPVKNSTAPGELFPRVVEIKWHEDIQEELEIVAKKIKDVCEHSKAKDRLSEKWAQGVGYNSTSLILYNISNGERLRSIERILGNRQNIPPPVIYYRYFAHKIEVLSCVNFPGILSNPKQQCLTEQTMYQESVQEAEVPTDQTILEIRHSIPSSSTTTPSTRYRDSKMEDIQRSRLSSMLAKELATHILSGKAHSQSELEAHLQSWRHWGSLTRHRGQQPKRLQSQSTTSTSSSLICTEEMPPTSPMELTRPSPPSSPTLLQTYPQMTQDAVYRNTNDTVDEHGRHNRTWEKASQTN